MLDLLHLTGHISEEEYRRQKPLVQSDKAVDGRLTTLELEAVETLAKAFEIYLQVEGRKSIDDEKVSTAINQAQISIAFMAIRRANPTVWRF